VVYADDVNLLDKNINIIKDTESVLDISKEVWSTSKSREILSV